MPFIGPVWPYRRITGRYSMKRFDINLVIILLISIITIAGFAIAIYNYQNSESYPFWVHVNTHKPAYIAIPIIGSNSSINAFLYDAYGKLLVNLTLVSSNSTYVIFSTGTYNIVPGYAYKVWVPQQNIVYDFGLQSPSIAQLSAKYYNVTLNPIMQDQYWRPR